MSGWVTVKSVQKWSMIGWLWWKWFVEKVCFESGVKERRGDGRWQWCHWWKWWSGMTKEVRLWGRGCEMWIRLMEWFRKSVPEVGCGISKWSLSQPDIRLHLNESSIRQKITIHPSLITTCTRRYTHSTLWTNEYIPPAARQKACFMHLPVSFPLTPRDKPRQQPNLIVPFLFSSISRFLPDINGQTDLSCIIVWFLHCTVCG